jgi:polygalacturonase
MNLTNIGIKLVENESGSYSNLVVDKELFRNIFYVLFNSEVVLYAYTTDSTKIDKTGTFVSISNKRLEKLKLFSRKMKLYKLTNEETIIEKNTNQCSAITKKGEQCKLLNRENSEYCWKHYILKIKNGIKKDKENEKNI